MQKTYDFNFAEKEDFFEYQAEEIVLYENLDDETYEVNANIFPDSMLSNFIASIDTENYILSGLYIYNVRFGQYNSITDRKHIWGLLGIEKGKYQNEYLSQRGKTYFGIVNLANIQHLSMPFSGTVILFLSKQELNAELLFEKFKLHQIEPESLHGFDEKLMSIVDLLSKNNEVVMAHFDLNTLSINCYGKVEKIAEQIKILMAQIKMDEDL